MVLRKPEVTFIATSLSYCKARMPLEEAAPARDTAPLLQITGGLPFLTSANLAMEVALTGVVQGMLRMAMSPRRLGGGRRETESFIQ